MPSCIGDSGYRSSTLLRVSGNAANCVCDNLANGTSDGVNVPCAVWQCATICCNAASKCAANCATSSLFKRACEKLTSKDSAPFNTCPLTVNSLLRSMLSLVAFPELSDAKRQIDVLSCTALLSNCPK
ncbi:hypothetical protein PSOS111911_20715 [Pseudoalteromonas ostreae]